MWKREKLQRRETSLWKERKLVSAMDIKGDSDPIGENNELNRSHASNFTFSWSE